MTRLLDLSRILFLFGLLALPINISTAQGGFYGALLLWLIDVIRDKRWSVFRSFHLSWLLLFVTAAVLSAVFGVNGAHAASKLYRLALLLVVFAVPEWFRDRPRELLYALAAVVFGCTILAFYDFVRVPYQLANGLKATLADTGNMRDPQFYTACLLICMVGAFSARKLKHQVILGTLMVPPVIALLLHQKFGSFLGLGAGLVLVAICFRRWKTIGAVLLIGVAALAIHPPSRARFVHKIHNEFDPNFGARGTLWRVVGPSFLKEHPWGAGYKATRYKDLVEHKHGFHMEKNLDHLHNNAYQLWAEIGPIGMGAWLLWMAAIFLRYFRARGSPFAAAGFCALAGLFINGFVEYNFGDSEPYMLFCFLMGLSGLGFAAHCFHDVNLSLFREPPTGIPGRRTSAG